MVRLLRARASFARPRLSRHRRGRRRRRLYCPRNPQICAQPSGNAWGAVPRAHRHGSRLCPQSGARVLGRPKGHGHVPGFRHRPCPVPGEWRLVPAHSCHPRGRLCRPGTGPLRRPPLPSPHADRGHRGSRARSLPGLSRCRHLLCQARRTGGTTPSLAKVFLPDPLAQALNSPVAIGGMHMSLGTILIIILILILLGVIPTWGHSRGWGYGPSGIVGLILIILLILLLLGKI